MSSIRGDALRKAAFNLEDGITFLNHGSYGATPKHVLARQQALTLQMESNPDQWYRRDYSSLWEAAVASLAKQLVDVEEKDLVFVKNATAAVNAVVNTLPLSKGDACLITSQTYGACANAVAHCCGRSGADLVTLDITRAHLASDDLMCEAFAGVLQKNDNIRFALLDHITSPTAVILPVKRLCGICKEHGVQVMVDGAHAPGNVPGLDLKSIGCDWYTGNLHKWLFVPKSCAFLWVRAERQAQAQAVVISHEWKSSFQERFKMQGTLDDTAFLAVPAAVEFIESVGGLNQVAAENHDLAVWAAEMLAAAWGTEMLVEGSKCCSMAVVKLPFETTSDEEDLFRLIWDRFNIVVPAVPMPGAAGAWCRISAQIYNQKSDYERLAEAILLLKAERT